MADLIKMDKKTLGGATMKKKRGKPCKKSVKNMQKFGSRRQVCVYGTAEQTTGGLTKKDLIINKWGRVVSRKKHAMGPKLLKNLMNSKKKVGWVAKKGKFGAKKVTGKALKSHLAKLARTRKNMGKKKGGKKNYNKTKKMKGGNHCEEEKEALEKCEKEHEDPDSEEDEEDPYAEQTKFFNPSQAKDGDYGQRTLDDKENNNEEEEEEEEKEE